MQDQNQKFMREIGGEEEEEVEAGDENRDAESEGGDEVEIIGEWGVGAEDKVDG